MNRRDFFKTILVTPMLTPFLLASKASANDDLYLLSDSPQIFLPSILQELKTLTIMSGQSYIFTNEHPLKNSLVQSLGRHGWTHAQKPSQAILRLSFRPLRYPARPSFTLVSQGQIWDIRAHRLRLLWQEMNTDHAPSSCLTIASLQTNTVALTPGETVRIYRNGQQIDELSLKKDRIKSYAARKAAIAVRIQERKVWVSDSSCRHKICCLAPPASFVSERIVCAPNRFLVEINGHRSIDTIIG